MKKRYSSPCIRFTVNIKKDDKQFPITFPLWDNENRRRFIIIEDEEVQKQLESLKDFGIYFHLDSGYLDMDAVEPSPGEKKDDEIIKTDILPAEEYETLADAKRFLASIGVIVYPSMNKAKAISVAQEKGIQLKIKN